MTKKRYAIIGIAYTLPGNIQKPEDLWRVLANQEDVISTIPPSRFNLKHPVIEANLATSKAGLIENVEFFDHAFFRMSKKEADSISVLQKLHLVTSHRAIENAGYSHGSMPRNTGVFVASTQDDFASLHRRDASKFNAFTNLTISPAVLSGRISNFFDFKGPSQSMDTACASSLYALKAATLALSDEQCEVAIVAAVNLIYGSFKTVLHGKSGMLSPTGRCHSFKAEADGYLRSEAAVSIIVKPLDKAIRDNDRILAVVDQVHTNHNGACESMKQPTLAGETECFRDCIVRSGVDPEEIEMVEAHGTGTVVGDKIEAEALKAVLRHEVYLTAVKSNLGHAESASGLVAIAKVIECFGNNAVPPIYRFQNPSPAVDFQNLKPVAATTPWTSETKRALICNYGFSGSNAAAVISSK